MMDNVCTNQANQSNLQSHRVFYFNLCGYCACGILVGITGEVYRNNFHLSILSMPILLFVVLSAQNVWLIGMARASRVPIHKFALLLCGHFAIVGVWLHGLGVTDLFRLDMLAAYVVTCGLVWCLHWVVCKTRNNLELKYSLSDLFVVVLSIGFLMFFIFRYEDSFRIKLVLALLAIIAILNFIGLLFQAPPVSRWLRFAYALTVLMFLLGAPCVFALVIYHGFVGKFANWVEYNKFIFLSRKLKRLDISM